MAKDFNQNRNRNPDEKPKAAAAELPAVRHRTRNPSEPAPRCDQSLGDETNDGMATPIRVRKRQSAPATMDAPSAAPDAGIEARDGRPDYLVGYGRPPAHSQFKPGRSGNPKGRPKGAKGLNTLVREMMTQKVSVRTATGEKKIRRIEALLLKALEAALKGNAAAQTQMLSRYAAAVPEESPAEANIATSDELTATDEAMLEELKSILLRQAKPQ